MNPYDKTPVKICLEAVDCPEKNQPFGTKAKQFTSDMVFGKVVTVKVVTRDLYGRTVAWISVGGKSLSEELLPPATVQGVGTVAASPLIFSTRSRSSSRWKVCW